MAAGAVLHDDPPARRVPLVWTLVGGGTKSGGARGADGLLAAPSSTGVKDRPQTLGRQRNEFGTITSTEIAIDAGLKAVHG